MVVLRTVPYGAANGRYILHALDNSWRIIAKGKPRTVIAYVAKARALLSSESEHISKAMDVKSCVRRTSAVLRHILLCLSADSDSNEGYGREPFLVCRIHHCLAPVREHRSAKTYPASPTLMSVR